MIYDCFPFYNELDLLEIRLNTLNDVVDKFVIVEMPVTHTGKEKPLYYEENKERYKEFHDKIIHIVVNNYPSLENSKVGADGNKWILENYQRDYILEGLKEAKNEDVIIISDADEIPNPQVVQQYAQNPVGIKKLIQSVYFYYLNNRAYDSYTQTPTICTYKDLLDPQVQIPLNELCEYSEYGKPTYLRWVGNEIARIQNGGWHFTFIGNIDQISEKITSIVEGPQWYKNCGLDSDGVKKAIEENHDLFNREFFAEFLTEKLDYTYPKYILENQDKYKHLIKEVTDSDRIQKLELENVALKQMIFQQNNMLKQVYAMIKQ